MPTSTVEDYLKTILLEEQRAAPRGQEAADDAPHLVTMGRIASALEVAPGTVTSMVKSLERSGLLDYRPYSGVRLSPVGRETALAVLRRHRLIELFLVETLGFDWAEVHDEAERLEHGMSDRVVDRIDALLGHPRFDPHGDPIPDAGGVFAPATSVRLRDCPPGPARVARVADQDEAFLKFAERHGLKPGAALVVGARDPVADAVTVDTEVGEVTLGGAAAAKLWIEPCDPSRSLDPSRVFDSTA